MTDPANYQMRTPPTWARDLGTLRAVADWESQTPGSNFGDAGAVAEATGLDVDLVQESLARWEQVFPPVLEGASPTMDALVFLGLTERGRRLVGLWPSADSVVDSLVAALETAADNEPDEGKQGMIRNAARVVGSMVRDVAVGVVTQQLGPAL